VAYMQQPSVTKCSRECSPHDSTCRIKSGLP